MTKQHRRPLALSMALATALAFAAGCKTDAPAASPPPARSDDTAAKPPANPAVAPEAKPPAPALPVEGAQGDGSPGADWRAKRAAELDKDGDGKVSDAERAAALHDRADQMRRRFDANHDGKLTPEELANARGRMLRFDDPAALDTDHDGDISTDELAAGFKARADARRGRRGSDAPGTQP